MWVDHSESKGWTAAGALAAAAVVGGLMFAIQSRRSLTIDEVESLGHSVDVAIALSVGYLTISRFSVHRRVERLAESVMAQHFNSEDLLNKFDAGQCDNDELSFVALFYFGAVDRFVSSVVVRGDEVAQTDFFRSWRGWALRWLCKGQVDRKFTMLLLVLLGLWILFAAAFELRPQLMNALSSRDAWIIWGAVLLALAWPAVNFALGEATFRSIKRSAERWQSGMAKGIIKSGLPEVVVPR